MAGHCFACSRLKYNLLIFQKCCWHSSSSLLLLLDFYYSILSQASLLLRFVYVALQFSVSLSSFEFRVPPHTIWELKHSSTAVIFTLPIPLPLETLSFLNLAFPSVTLLHSLCKYAQSSPNIKKNMTSYTVVSSLATVLYLFSHRQTSWNKSLD